VGIRAAEVGVRAAEVGVRTDASGRWKMKNLIWKMENPGSGQWWIARRQRTGFSIYHFPFAIFHLNGKSCRTPILHKGAIKKFYQQVGVRFCRPLRGLESFW